jgi:hypothetical protein
MLRVYARYSSDQQREASIEDQVRLCRLHAEKQGWSVSTRSHDRAASGASLIRRSVDEAFWRATEGRQTELAIIFAIMTMGVRKLRAKRFNRAWSPVFLLSGLLDCGRCGKGGIISKERYGGLSCHRRASRGNNRTILRPVIEERVLAGLTDRLVSPEAVAEAANGFHEVYLREQRVLHS